ncbi:hypothetical protein [Thermosulfurimonas dismutans]|uniref:Uncharacterized protein n=1 Tax=Thermosulfurimonas dismutans TaxID=999894 RepID=A0A179D605_9BACT|nr:hypothetical protein [Thermosulfurimonas dismutans]OAQ21038.1 hypothetical protein TDIS_0964 [Thermosulfurimonas dismutans]
MKIIFDPEIPEDLREDIKAAVEEEGLEEKCPECGAKEIYVALLGKVLDVKCYDCGYSYAEIEMEEE